MDTSASLFIRSGASPRAVVSSKGTIWHHLETALAIKLVLGCWQHRVGRSQGAAQHLLCPGLPVTENDLAKTAGRLSSGKVSSGQIIMLELEANGSSQSLGKEKHPCSELFKMAKLKITC